MPQCTGSSSGAYLRAHALMACSTARACFRSESVFVYSCRSSRASSRVFTRRSVVASAGRGRRTGDDGPARAGPAIPGVAVVTAGARLRLDLLERAAERAAGEGAAARYVPVADYVQRAVVVGGNDLVTGQGVRRGGGGGRSGQKQKRGGGKGRFHRILP